MFSRVMEKESEPRCLSVSVAYAFGGDAGISKKDVDQIHWPRVIVCETAA